MCPNFYFFSLGPLCAPIFSNTLGPSCVPFFSQYFCTNLLNHILRERSLFVEHGVFISKTCFLSTSSVGVEYFDGWRHVLAYS